MKTIHALTAAAVVFCSALAACNADPNPNQLGASVFRNLTNYCPTIDAKTLSGFSGYIAAQVSGATNFDTLNKGLISVFSTDTNLNWLGWQTNGPLLTIAASAIAIQQFPTGDVVVSPHFPIIEQEDHSPNNWGQVLLWTGDKMLNSYSIDRTTKTLQAAGSDSRGYVEIAFNERYVMRSGKYDDISLDGGPEPKRLNDSKVHWVPWRSKVPDVDASFGYLFNGSSSTSSNVNISTIVGSSDIYGDVSIGVPLFRYCSADYQWKQQLTLEINYGFATDKNFTAVHPTLFVGGGYQGKFPNFIGSTNMPIYWFGRIGMARIDQPQISGTNVVFHSTGGLSEPAFEENWVPSLGTSIIIPVTSALSLQAGGNVYFAEPPASWNITLGVTLDLSKLSKGLGTALGFQQ